MGQYTCNGLGSTGVITPAGEPLRVTRTGAAVRECPAGYTPAVREQYDAMGRAMNVSYCKRNAACVDASQTFHVDDVVAFSWKIADAAGREQTFTTPDIRVGRWFSRGATGFQLARRALSMYPESRTGGRATSPVCVMLKVSAGAASGPLPGSVTLDMPPAPGRAWTILGAGGGSAPRRSDSPTLPNPFDSGGVDASGAEAGCPAGGGLYTPPDTATDGGAVDTPPDTVADGEGASSSVSHFEKYRSAIAAVALVAAAYAGWRVYKAGKASKKSNRGRSRRRRNGMGKFHIKQVRINSGGYDSRGRYWGLGAPLFRYSAEEEDPSVPRYHDDYIDDHIRARDREDAKAKIRQKYPNAKFAR